MADEISPQIIEKTQKTLGKYVNKPPLTEKLLKKPPFRFLHDVTNTVIRETGFLKGLFTDSELMSDNIKDRDGKVAFLNKLITATKELTGIDLQVRASKIIAGLEPAETNKLLQAIGTAIDKKVDSKEYVSKLNSKGKTKVSKPKESEKIKKVASKTSNKSEKSNESVKSKTRESNEKASRTSLKVATPKTPKDVVKKDSKEAVEKKKISKIKESPRVKKSTPRETQKSTPRETPKAVPIAPVTPQKTVISNELNNVMNEDKISPINKPDTILETESIDDILKKSPEADKIDEKPKSGKEKIVVEEKLVIDKPPANVLEVKPVEPILRPKSALRPPSVRPSSARPGAPRLRPESSLPLKEIIPLGKINVIVENFGDKEDKEEDEEETVVIQNIEEIPDPILLEKSLDIPVAKGHLVEQILEQIQGPEQLEEHVKGSIDWEQDSSRGRDATTKEINQLRASIQSLTKTANPLGKLMSYLHEDVEAMHSELESWTSLKRQYVSEITKQKKLNSEANQPLIKQLQELEDSIKKQKEEITIVKFNVLKNEDRIRDLIDKQVVVQ